MASDHNGNRKWPVSFAFVECGQKHLKCEKYGNKVPLNIFSVDIELVTNNEDKNKFQKQILAIEPSGKVNIVV